MRRSEKGIDPMTQVYPNTIRSHLIWVVSRQLKPSKTLVADPTLRSIEDIIADLSRPVNPRRLRPASRVGKQITYLPWYQADQIPGPLRAGLVL